MFFYQNWFHTWDQGPLDLSTIPWSLLINSMHDTRDHSICLYITMVSSYQFYTWEHGPLYLSKRPWCCIDREWESGLWSHVWNWCEETMMLHIQRYELMYGIGEKRPWCCIDWEWSLFSCIELDHSICLYNNMVSSCQFHTWDHRPLCIYNIMVFSHQFQTIEHSVMYGISEKRPWCWIDREWSMVSCMELVWRDHDVAYTEVWTYVWNWWEETMGLFLPILFMRTWTTLSVYTTPLSLLTNYIHETRDHSICLQYHGVFSPSPYMRPGPTLSRP
jgi:hypothetical protein